MQPYKILKHLFFLCNLPNDDIMKVNEGSIVRPQQINWIPNHSTGPAAIRAGVHEALLFWENLKHLQLGHSVAEKGLIAKWQGPMWREEVNQL